MADIYNEEFHQYMNLARRLGKNLRDEKGTVINLTQPPFDGQDLNLYKKWLRKICSLDSDDLIVKKNRNAFFKYVLHVLQDGRLEAPFTELQLKAEEKSKDACPCINPPVKEEEEKEESRPFTCYWSPDASTYVSVQPLEGCGALVFMAISYDTRLGWDIP